MNYSYIPQKFKPIYSNNQICHICGSNNSFPLTNSVGSLRYCSNCKNTFNPQIVGYQEVVMEKNLVYFRYSMFKKYIKIKY